MLKFFFDDRVIVVTGAGSGIGRACAVMAAASGAKVLVADMSSASVDAVVKEIETLGGAALGAVFDVRDRDAVFRSMECAEENLGPIYGLVASAGVGGGVPAASMTPEAWDRVLDTNLGGMFNCVQAAGVRMLQHGTGSIVAIGSGSGLAGTLQRAHYCASKFGVNGMVQALALEWGRQGVRVNCVAPGPVDTPLLRKSFTQKRLDRMYLDRMPLGRLSTPEDQAKVAMFLLSDGAGFMTGTIIPVNGGLTAGFATSYGTDD